MTAFWRVPPTSGFSALHKTRTVEFGHTNPGRIQGFMSKSPNSMLRMTLE
jgi:hypothetical protein